MMSLSFSGVCPARLRLPVLKGILRPGPFGVTMCFLGGQALSILWEPVRVGKVLLVLIGALAVGGVVSKWQARRWGPGGVAQGSQWPCAAALLLSCYILGALSVSPLLLARAGTDRQEVVQGIVEGSIRRPQAGAIQFRFVGYPIHRRIAQVRHPHEGRPLSLICRAIDLPWRAGTVLRSGDQVRLVAKVKAFDGSQSLSGYEKALHRSGLDGSCVVLWMTVERSVVGFRGDEGSLFRSYGDMITHAMGSGATAAEMSGMLLSMSFGVRDQMSRGTEDLFRSYGLSHLLVISGYQLSQLMRMSRFLITGITKPLWRFVDRMPFSILGCCVSLAIAVLVCAMAGFEVSISRALIGACIVEAVQRQEGIGGLGHSLVVTVLIMSALWPGVCFEPAGALTISALLGILIGSSLGGPGWRGVVGAHAGALLCTYFVSCLWFRPPSLIAAALAAPFATVFSTVVFQGTLLGLGALLLGFDSKGIIIRMVGRCAEWVRTVLWNLQ